MSKKVKCECCGKEINYGDMAYHVTLLPNSANELKEDLCSACMEKLVDGHDVEAELVPFVAGSERPRVR